MNEPITETEYGESAANLVDVMRGAMECPGVLDVWQALIAVRVHPLTGERLPERKGNGLHHASVIAAHLPAPRNTGQVLEAIAILSLIAAGGDSPIVVLGAPIVTMHLRDVLKLGMQTLLDDREYTKALGIRVERIGQPMEDISIRRCFVEEGQLRLDEAGWSSTTSVSGVPPILNREFSFGDDQDELRRVSSAAFEKLSRSGCILPSK